MLELTNNKGMGVRIIDGVGIEIFSDKVVEISSMEMIQIKSKKKDVRIIAPKSISLIQNNTSVVLKEHIVIEGAQTKVQ